MARQVWIQFGLIGLLASWGLSAQAQTLTPSQRALPGNVSQDYRLKDQPSVIQPDRLLKKQGTSEVEDTRKPADDDKMEAPVKKVFIKSIRIEGASLLDDQIVRNTIAQYENRENSFADLQELTDKLTQMYQQKGYATSRVYIPPQKLVNETFTLKALEGTMGKLKVNNGKYFKRRSVAFRVKPEEMKAFNLDELKASLRTLNENPDRNVKAKLMPGDKTGETDVELDITDRFPIHFTPSFDNLGRHTLGNNRVGLRLEDNNVTGFGDTLLSSVSISRRSYGLVNRYELPINRYGTKVGFEHAYSALQLGEELSALNVQGKAATYSPFISQSFINTEKYKLYADLAFDFKEIDTNVGGQDFSHDALRIIRPAINFEEYDRFGRTYLRHEIGWGVPLFGGSMPFDNGRGRVGAGSQFFRYTGSLIRTNKLPWNSYGIFKLLGQYSPDRLVSAEQFQAGGAFTVRGYREGVVTGDKGLILSAEWRIPAYMFPKTWHIPYTSYGLRDNIQIVPFWDFGLVGLNNPTPGVDAREYVMGAGIGTRFKLTRYLSGRLDLGLPMMRQGDNQNSARLHFGLESSVF